MIDFYFANRLLRRTDGVEVWAQKNAKPGVVISNLLPATPYTLFISVFDGQNDPFKITEQFTTAESGKIAYENIFCNNRKKDIFFV